MPRTKGDTANLILDQALLQFSHQGYGATSVRDIAEAVGIKAASLYNHFPSKQDIFDKLIQRETTHVESLLHSAGAMAMPEDDPRAYAKATGKDLEALVWESYAPFFEDSRVKMLHRMLAISRYEDERCNHIYKAVFIKRPLELQSRIFTALVREGLFQPCDTQLAAMEFHGPMLMLISCETEAAEARSFCLHHVRAFNKAHSKEDR